MYRFTRAGIFFLVLMLFAARPVSGGAAPAPADPEEALRLEKLVQLLEDPEEARKLAGQIKSLLETQRKLAPKEDTAIRPIVPANLFKLFETYKSKTKAVSEKIGGELRGLPGVLDKSRDFLTVQENRQHLLSFFIKLIFAVSAGFLLWLLLRRLTRKMQESLEKKEHLATSRKLAGALISCAFKLYPWAGLYLSCHLFFLTVPVAANIRAAVLNLLLSLFLYFGILCVLGALLSPEHSERRLIPLNDALAGYIYVWSRRLLLFSLWIYLILIPSAAFEMKTLQSVISGIHQVGMAILLAIILAQWKEKVGRLLCLTPNPEEPEWKRNIKTVCNHLVRKLYFVFILYLGMIIILPVLGFSNFYAYFLTATLKSIFIILLTIGTWIVWDILLKKLFAISATLKVKYPDIEDHVNRYVSFFWKAGHWVIAVLATLSVMDAWGLGTMEFVSANSKLLQPLIHIPLIILLAVFLIHAKDLLIGWLEKKVTWQMLDNGKVSRGEIEKRVSTLSRILRQALLVSILGIIVMMILNELGFNIAPILTGAGILGLAVGFGSQNLVRDIISGLFLIIENRIRIGDVAIINGTGGLVEQINPRTTVLRSQDGTIHVFPNGSITSLSNMTYGYSFYVFDVGIAYKEDVDRVMQVLRELGDEIMKDETYGPSILEPIEIMGVDKFADSAVIVKARIKTLPIKQWAVGREMNRRIKLRFDELNIEIPFPHTSLYFGEASKPFRVEGSGTGQEEMKQAIREVLAEGGTR